MFIWSSPMLFFNGPIPSRLLYYTRTFLFPKDVLLINK